MNHKKSVPSWIHLLRVLLVLLIMWTLAASPAMAQKLLFRWDGEGDYARLGWGVSGGHDLNGDGYLDLVASGGPVSIYSGKDGALMHSFLEDELFQVACIDDVSGDGISDLLVGAPTADGWSGYGSGEAYVYAGGSWNLVTTFTGEGPSQGLGARVAPAGDLDGDGVTELLISAPGYANYPPFSNMGRVYLRSGATGDLIGQWTGENQDDRLGSALAMVGDIDGKGLPDILIGAHMNIVYDKEVGRAYLYSGETRDVIRFWEGTSRYQALGTAVSGLGDVNDDGTPDVLVGAVGWDTSTGAAYVFSGDDGSLVYEHSGKQQADSFGAAVRGIGDANGDAYPDYLVCSIYDDTAGEDLGAAFLYSGRTGRLLYAFYGEAQYDGIGLAMSEAGDINGDGLADFILGARGHDTGGEQAGRAYVFAGNDLFLQAEPSSLADGDAVSLHTRGGVPGALALLAAVEANGVPVFAPLAFGVLDANSEWSLQATVPPGLGDVTIGLKSFAQKGVGGGALADSEVERIVISSQ